VFGLSFGELVMVLIVAVIVLGPKELPRYLRKAGQLAGQLRRMAYDMREKSGIDDVLRTEGIDRDIAEIRKLARGEIADVAAAIRSATSAVRANDVAASPYVAPPPVNLDGGAPPLPEREYPCEGADSYGALPDSAQVYDGALAASPLADDPLYARGDAGPSLPSAASPPSASVSPSTTPAPTVQ
jgi:sec-independent protein translocase protein TatB